MSEMVTILFTQGKLKGQTLTFSQPTRCLLGRGLDCYPRFPEREEYMTISRHHCRIDVLPPKVFIRDLGSMNGTWVNGLNIGQRDEKAHASRTEKLKFRTFELRDGDEVSLGTTSLMVQIMDPNETETLRPVEVDQKERNQAQSAASNDIETISGQENTILLSDMDADEDETAEDQQPLSVPKACIECGGTLTRRSGFQQQGYLCWSCLRDPEAVAGGLLKQAQKGVGSLGCLEGVHIVKPLGRGATGAAFLVKKEGTKMPFALKILLPEAATSRWARESFLREVANCEALRHPNVVRMYDSGNWQGIFFYTMEYCNGGSLDYVQKQHDGIMPIKEGLQIILQALDGLHYIHNVEIHDVKLAGRRSGKGRGLVHRDLKPANIFLSLDGDKRVAKIADVGVGKAFDTAGLSGLTRTGTVAGSPVTMPRQQVINFKYARPDVDVWAMAATLYKILTNHYPRHFPPEEDAFRVVLTTAPLPIRERNSKVPPRLAEVIDAALIDDPAITFQTALQFKKALIGAV